MRGAGVLLGAGIPVGAGRGMTSLGEREQGAGKVPGSLAGIAVYLGPQSSLFIKK